MVLRSSFRKNLLGEFLSKATTALAECPSSVKCDLQQSKSRSKVANHSARKTSITSLLDENISPLHVSQLSGHKNPESLKSYHTANTSMQKQMSNIINNNVITQHSNNRFRPYHYGESSLMENNHSLFNGAVMNNCTFNIYFESNETKRKRVRLIEDSDSEKEM